MASQTNTLRTVKLMGDLMEEDVISFKNFMRMDPDTFIHIGKIQGISNPDKAGVNRDLPESTRNVPDVFGGYTEVHGAYKEEYGSFFIRELRDEKLSKLYFSPGHAG